MPNRRSFIKLTGAAAFGAAFIPKAANAFFNKPAHAVGVQLFTFFEIMDADVTGTLKKIAVVGFKEIESAFSKKGGYYGMTAKEFANVAKDHGLSWQSHHVLGAPFKLPAGAKMPVGADGKPITIAPMKNLRDNFQEIVDDVAAAGVPYLVCASTPFGTAEELKSSIDTLNKAGESARKAGLTFCYHNHDKEFEQQDGKVIYDRMLKETDAANVKMELDLCWVTKAGVDPVALFKKHPGRFPLWHVKDLDKDKQGPVPVGTGIVDFKRIFDNADVSGMKHFFVEHDLPKDPWGSVTTSFENLKKMGE